MALPKVIGSYHIVELLGRGGMGEVYKAIDTRMHNRPVALKLISEALGADPRALHRFDLEIETAANLRHPNIVQIYDRGEFEGRRYFAMEFLEGRDLGGVIQDRSARSLEGRVELITQLCEALDYAHTREKVVIHRDIKPANVLVITHAGTDHVKLLDFGIAHVAKSEHTRTVVQPGTTLYMSPEQLKDEPVTPRSDLFSVGIVAYELFAGVHPFRGRTDYLTSSNIMFERQPPLRSLEPDAPETLEILVDRLLEKDAQNRMASAAEAAAALRKVARQLRSAPTEQDSPSLGNVDEMTTLMVERIVHFAKAKERAHALPEALEAYKRALLLAPSASWLEAQVTRIQSALSGPARVEAEPADDSIGLHTSSRNRHRESFVNERLAAAGTALDEGDLDTASSIVAEVLRRYPDDARALDLMDRIVLITDRGVDVKPYRQAIRAAREALATGDVAAARRSCAAAVAIWPDDDEVISLDLEIERVRQAEIGKTLAACEAVVTRASTRGIADEALESATLPAREALLRAGELGAPPAIIDEKTRALDRLVAEASVRIAERLQLAEKADHERRAEITRLLGDARRAIEAGERVRDAVAAAETLPGLRSAAETLSRAQSLGADEATIADLSTRRAGATAALERVIEKDEEQERAALASLDAVRTGIAEIEALLAGPVAGLTQAESQVSQLRAVLDSVTSSRPSVPASGELRGKLDAAGTRIGKARVARERLAVLLEEARAAYREADDLATSIETEADRMGAPLAAARRAVKEMLKIESGNEEAQALLKRIDALEGRAAGQADNARRLRKEAQQRELDRIRELEERRRAGLRRLLVRGAIGVIVAAVLAGGWFAYSRWAESRESAAKVERERHEAERAQAAEELRQAGSGLARLRAGIAAIKTDDAREQALSECDALITKIKEAQTLDSGNRDAVGLMADASTLRGELQALDFREAVIIPPAPPPETPTTVSQEPDVATVKLIREDLKFADNVPRGPIAEVERGIARADHGIELAKGILASHPAHAETKVLLGQLQSTRKTLERWRQDLVAEGANKIEQQKKDLASANALIEKAEAALKSGGDLVQARADSQHVTRILDSVLREDPRQPDALSLRARNDTLREGLDRPPVAPIKPPSTPEKPVEPVVTKLDMGQVNGLFSEFKTALVARDPDAIRRVYPSYPSLDALLKLQQFEYGFTVESVDEERSLAVVRETTRMRHPPGYWDPSRTAVLRYVLSRTPDGRWLIQSGTTSKK